MTAGRVVIRGDPRKLGDLGNDLALGRGPTEKPKRDRARYMRGYRRRKKVCPHCGKEL